MSNINEYPKTQEAGTEPQDNQESISYTTDDVVIMPNTLKAVIISVDKKWASEVFGKENLKGDDRTVLHLTYENRQYGITNHETIGFFPNGKVPDRSKLAKFLKRYHKLDIGVEVDLIKNAEGFYKLVLD